MVEQLITEIFTQSDVRSALSQLRKVLKDAPEKKALCAEEEFLSRLFDLLSHEDGKTRKNTALLLGNLADTMPDHMKAKAPKFLWVGFRQETTKFVQSSYIQSMAAFSCDEYIHEIRTCYNTLLETEVNPEDVKHTRELRKALEQILASREQEQSLTFRGLKKKHPILLEAEPYIRELLCERLSKEYKTEAKVTASGVRVVTDSLEGILKTPLYRELLFAVRQKTGCVITEANMAEGIVSSELLPLLEEVFDAKGPFTFRLSFFNEKGAWDGKKLKQLAFSIEEQSKHRLCNSTERYVVEIQLRRKKDNTYGVFAHIPQATRGLFSYCVKRLPTSMSPVLAAQMVALVHPYLKEGAHIIDPFCGVGTLLIERTRAVGARDIYGVDTYGEAIAIARDQTGRAGMEFYYINRDYFDFTTSHLMEEVLTEFPRMEHKDREEVDDFYHKFFEKTMEVTSEQAVLILLSTEESCMKKQLRLHKEFALIRQIPMRGRENIFIIKRRG